MHAERAAARPARPAADKKAGSTGIRREDEPDEYWSSKGEREGKNPMSDPLAQIGVLAILFPFIFLAVGEAPAGRAAWLRRARLCCCSQRHAVQACTAWRHALHGSCRRQAPLLRCTAGGLQAAWLC